MGRTSASRTSAAGKGGGLRQAIRATAMRLRRVSSGGRPASSNPPRRNSSSQRTQYPEQPNPYPSQRGRQQRSQLTNHERMYSIPPVRRRRSAPSSESDRGILLNFHPSRRGSLPHGTPAVGLPIRHSTGPSIAQPQHLISRSDSFADAAHVPAATATAEAEVPFSSTDPDRETELHQVGVPDDDDAPLLNEPLRNSHPNGMDSFSRLPHRHPHIHDHYHRISPSCHDRRHHRHSHRGSKHSRRYRSGAADSAYRSVGSDTSPSPYPSAADLHAAALRAAAERASGAAGGGGRRPPPGPLDGWRQWGTGGPESAAVIDDGVGVGVGGGGGVAVQATLHEEGQGEQLGVDGIRVRPYTSSYAPLARLAAAHNAAYPATNRGRVVPMADVAEALAKGVWYTSR